MFLTHAVRIVDEFEQAGYTDGSEAESDEEPAKDYIEDIRQILRDLVGDISFLLHCKQILF